MATADTNDLRDIKATLERLEPMLNRINERLSGIEATLPHLAARAELVGLRTDLLTQLTDKPGKAWLTGAIAVLLAAYALGLASLAALPALRAVGG
jgi:hypothetical protein